MGADLHIHVLEGCTEADYRVMCSHTLGSKYHSWEDIPQEHLSKARKAIMHSPQIWVGSVSWLKAALFEDKETFIPDMVGQVCTLVGEDFPVIDDRLMMVLREAFTAPNTTNYEVASWEKVETFLKAHWGKQVFCISW